MIVRAEAPPWWLFALFAAIAIVALIASHVAARKRREAWQRLAASLGMPFSPADPLGLITSDHPLFRHGHSKRVSNVMYGEYRGRTVRCFDYRYTVGSGKNSHTYFYSVVGVCPPVWFEPVFIRPEGFGDRIAHWVGIDDIDFESDEFSRRYYVKAENKRFAYGLLHQRAMQFLLDRPNVVIEGSSYVLLFHDPKSGLSELPDGVMRLLTMACDFLELTPDYLIADRRPRTVT